MSKMAIDLEWYDQTNGAHVKEIGIAIQIDSTITYHHFIIQEHSHLINRYSKNNPDGFAFGTSILLPRTEAISKLTKLLENVDIILVHNGMHDKRILRLHGVELNEIIDTGDIVKRVLGSKQPLSLMNACKQFGVDTMGSFHNAGNDAAYTLALFNRLQELGHF